MALNTRIQTRRDTAANWEAKNPVLLEGELIIVTTNAGDTRFKIGDGVKTYTQLPFQDESLYNVLSAKAEAADLEAIQSEVDSFADTVVYKSSSNEDISTEIEDNGGASGGPQVQSDLAQNDDTQPDYVKNRTHWVEEGVALEDVVPEATYEFANNMSVGGNTWPFVLDETYIVNWDGTDYECVCYATTFQGMEALALGNEVLIGGTIGNDEPFMAGYIPSQGLAGFITSDNNTHVASIKKSVYGEVVHKIDNKYIEPLYAQATDSEVLMEETELTFNNNQSVTMGVETAIVVGERYVVIYDGVKYELECVEGTYNGMPCQLLGNVGIMGGTDTGEPFLFGVITGMGQGVWVTDTEPTHTIGVKTLPETKWKIDNKYIDAEWMAKETSEVLYSGTVEATGEHQQASAPIGLVAGEELSVTINGETVYTTAVDVYGMKAIDNVAVPSGGTFVWIDNANVGDVQGPVYMFSVAGTYEVEIKRVSIPKLPEKFLPDAATKDTTYTLSKLGDTTIKLIDNEGNEQSITDADHTYRIGWMTNQPNTLYLSDQYGNRSTVNINPRITYTLSKSDNILTLTPSSGDAQRVTLTDNDTTYTLSKSGTTITLTPSSGSAQSITVIGESGDGRYSEVFNKGGNVAYGDFSHAEGISTVAFGEASHAEGRGFKGSPKITIAANSTEGTYDSTASNVYAGGILIVDGIARKTTSADSTAKTFTVESAFGDVEYTNKLADFYDKGALSEYSHAEGYLTTASGYSSHAEGNAAEASGNSSHAEGSGTIASGSYSHAEGCQTTASGLHSHAEGSQTIASGKYSHAEGYETVASGDYSHAEGKRSQFNSKISIAANSTEGVYSGNSPLVGYIAVVDDIERKITSVDSTAKTFTVESAFGDVEYTDKSVYYYRGIASGDYSHAEGYNTTASGDYSHAEGYETIASGNSSHTEGQQTTASGLHSHAEGYNTTASGLHSHAEGYNTTASGNSSHTEGQQTTASGSRSHAEGVCTIAASEDQHVQGKWNIEDANKVYAHIVGNGISDDRRSNAHTLDWDGNAWFDGTVESTALILTSPNGTRFKITVSDDGTLSAAAAT